MSRKRIILLSIVATVIMAALPLVIKPSDDASPWEPNNESVTSDMEISWDYPDFSEIYCLRFVDQDPGYEWVECPVTLPTER